MGQMDKLETFPPTVQAYLKDTDVIIIKNKLRSAVYLLLKSNCNMFLKVTPKGHMKSESMMTDYLNTYEICPKVLLYTSDDSKDYLITEQIAGADASTEKYISKPMQLTKVFAESLLNFQKIKCEKCPV